MAQTRHDRLAIAVVFFIAALIGLFTSESVIAWLCIGIMIVIAIWQDDMAEWLSRRRRNV